MERSELIKSDGYWTAKIETLLYYKNYKGKDRQEVLIKELLALKNELINLERLEWFKARIGKRIYILIDTCKCETCLNAANKGVLISDEGYANHLASASLELNVTCSDEPFK